MILSAERAEIYGENQVKVTFNDVAGVQRRRMSW